MGIGERIKYFRKERRWTQNELADRSAIHPVSIRKYETNKMEPMPPQIERIADALNVSYTAIAGNGSVKEAETYGDLIGLLIRLCRMGVLEIVSERDEQGISNYETAYMRVKPYIAKYFGINGSDEKISEIECKLKPKKQWEDLIFWWDIYCLYLRHREELKDDKSEGAKRYFDEFDEKMEIIEMNLQKHQDPLNW